MGQARIVCLLFICCVLKDKIGTGKIAQLVEYLPTSVRTRVQFPEATAETEDGAIHL